MEIANSETHFCQLFLVMLKFEKLNFVVEKIVKVSRKIAFPNFHFRLFSPFSTSTCFIFGSNSELTCQKVKTNENSKFGNSFWLTCLSSIGIFRSPYLNVDIRCINSRFKNEFSDIDYGYQYAITMGRLCSQFV
jgi:hypothetical protein